MKPSSHSHHCPAHAAHDASHGTLKRYVIGMVLSVLLTLVSFGAVMTDVVPRRFGLAAITVACVAQLIVQLVYFLHIGSARSQRANTGIFLCTGFLIAVIVGLSLWVIHNANVNMMPTHITIERALAKD
ncbi:cytochrome o ubiquinol oxidase subunit IV [Burkholderia plantarii]|uniref:Cytochrome bo(3) ubiquinol oxidase subunit 4 n=1 Tax=Burkholderia plantarii TaxID=41899 RepID=A0A0B6S216_BURPL|nr:cytochrome o ubiquinol oxidase subunit IV [Burkholderia plantarii]AJK48424.1 putative cyoD: cytochrome o ubiquinol oxidase protein cyoD [Burkholderia plantarii]